MKKLVKECVSVILVLLVATMILAGLWCWSMSDASAVPPHYTGDTVAQNRPNLVVDPSLEMARGMVKGIATVNKFGRNFDIDSATTADIWDKGEVGGTLIYVAPTAARKHTIKSSDALDVTSGLELTLTGQPTNTNTCTIGTKVYTFLDEVGTADGNVHIGVNEEGTINNFVNAVNLGAGAGTAYGNLTTANTISVIAVKTAADDFTIYTVASTPIAVAETMDNATWDGGGIITVAGTGARTLRIYGLTSWNTAAVTEDISMQGLSSVSTVNSYVLIHRMKVLTKGGTTVNAGSIDATAATDATISARIRIGQGQTQMAIFGVPSTQTAYMKSFYASCNKTGGAAGLVDITLLVNPEPDVEEKMFLTKHTCGLQTIGSTVVGHHYSLPKVIPGPAIIKMQCSSGTDTMDISAGFDLILVDN